MINKVAKYSLYIFMPVLIVVWVVFSDRISYSLIIFALTIIACALFFLSYEEKKVNIRQMTVIAVMTAISVCGRFIFASLPGFKPVTAIVVITALYFGPEAGFLTGALSAVISNFYFGQGTWTPFQMLVWGLIGFIAGIFAKKLLSSKLWLSVFGIISGILFSLLMDIWTVLWIDSGFNLYRYLLAVASSLPFMAIYAVSNFVFLLVLTNPIGKVLSRIKLKYGI